MLVIIVGGGRTGSQLARLLLQQNYEVRVVDDRKEILSNIHLELPSEVIVEGDPMHPDVLERAGIQNADVLAACTTRDEVNLVLAYFAREHYGVARTISRVNNPRDAWLFNKLFDVDVALNQAEILARLIEEEMSMGDMMTLLKLRRGRYSLVEEKIAEGAPGIGIAIKDLGLPEQCVIAAIIRQGEVMIPRGTTTMELGDEVLAITDKQGALQLAEILMPPNRLNGHNNNGNKHGKVD